MKQAPKRGRGRPPIKDPATEQIHLRVTKDRKARYQKAADKSKEAEGNLTRWLLDVADKAS